MIPPDLEALVLADAAGALDSREQDELRQRLAMLPPDARAEVSRLTEIAVTLALSASQVAPPPHVRTRLLAHASGPSRYTVAAAEGEWAESGVPGFRVKVLKVNEERGVVTMLMRADPGARYPAHRHSEAEECYVISGTLVIDGRVLRAGDFHHADANSEHGEVITDQGAEVLLVVGLTDYLGDHQ